MHRGVDGVLFSLTSNHEYMALEVVHDSRHGKMWARV